MDVELDFSNCNSFELLDIYEDVKNEITNRLGNYIYKAKNGFIYPKRCPNCDGSVFIICNGIHYTDVEVEAIKNSASLGEPWERWRNFLKELIRDGQFELPPGVYSFAPVEVTGPGDWFCAYCSCKIGDWSKSYDEAVESWWQRKLLKLES